MTRLATCATILAFAAMLSSGCYRHALIVDGASSGPADASYYTHHMLWGLVNLSGPRSVGNLCSDGVSELRVKGNGISFVAYMFLGALYTPMRVKVWCNHDGSVSMEAEPQDTDSADTLATLADDRD